MALDGTMCPSQKLLRFVLFEQKTNVNNEHQLIPGIGTAILGMMEPHCRNSLRALLLSPKFLQKNFANVNTLLAQNLSVLQILDKPEKN